MHRLQVTAAINTRANGTILLPTSSSDWGSLLVASLPSGLGEPREDHRFNTGFSFSFGGSCFLGRCSA